MSSIFDINAPMSRNYIPGRVEVLQLTRQEYEQISRGLVHQASVIIVDGKMIKSRYGKPGTDIEGALFVWDEIEV